jgi:predicted nucleotidyltransferase
MYTHQIVTNRTAEELMRDNMLVKHLAGSHAYGTSTPTSDVDYRGVFCADPINLRTPFFVVKESEDQNEEDTKLFELSHFVRLCLDCNPNVVETLWVDNADITFRTPAYDFLRSYRDEFLSSKIAFTTSGYALAQLKRIKGHNKWLTQAENGIAKLRQAYQRGDIGMAWLEQHFDESTINKVTTRG